jgi:hypothetical protein
VYERTSQKADFAVNGELLLPQVSFESNARVQPFVVLFSDGAHAQLLKDWIYPNLWEEFFLNKI